MTGQSVDVQSEICNLIYFPVGFIFNFQRLFPVLEEGVFANIALNHDSSLKSLFWISPPRSSFQHAQPPTWGALAEPQHTLRVLEGSHLALASFSLKNIEA